MIGTFALPGAGSHHSSSSPPRPGARGPPPASGHSAPLPILGPWRRPCARDRLASARHRGPPVRCRAPVPKGTAGTRVAAPLACYYHRSPAVGHGHPWAVTRAVQGGAFTDPQLPVGLLHRSDQSAASSGPLPRFMSVRSSRRPFAPVAARKPDPQQAPRTCGLRFRPHRAALTLTDPSHHSRSRTARQPGNTTVCHAASQTGMFTACRGALRKQPWRARRDPQYPGRAAVPGCVLARPPGVRRSHSELGAGSRRRNRQGGLGRRRREPAGPGKAA